MTPALVLSQLLDLPAPFMRPGSIYAQIMASLAGSEALYTTASDGIQFELSMPTSLNGWLGVWGEILGIPRNPNESDFFYSLRVQQTLVAPVGTPQGIQTWSRFILGTQSIYVVENLATASYTIQIPVSLPTTAISNWLSNLARIRPAGIPFNVQITTSPLMLGTYSYVGASGFAGAYLGTGAQAYSLNLNSSTNNIQPLVSEILLQDPLLNGQIQLGFPF